MASKFSDAHLPKIACFAEGTATSGSGGAIDMTGFDRGVYIVSGSCSTSATVDWLIYESATASGTYTAAAATSGSAAFTQMTASTDNEPYILEVVVNAAKPHQKLVYDIGGSGNAAVYGFGFGERGNSRKPPTQENTVGKV